ncbi:MAG TPA: helix-turn-helix transcriptional regulator [Candidatus Elarobacter sp.]|jgi:predicted XRE-type DNA-binding protein|nr:helix-turn-helix transcriptional regulator [Candidatus Elarobacter sp.]
MKKTTGTSDTLVKATRRTGNVFAQLERPGADDLLRKARVLRVIHDVIEERHLDQTSTSKALRIDQADVSRLMNGKLSRFSLDRLLTFVDRLGVAVELHQKRDAKGRLVVEVASRSLVTV